MINNSTQHSKLDEAVKNALNNYEASGSDADWSKMERMLDSVPKSTSFKWSYSLTMVIGMAVLVGGYFLYTGTKPSKPADNVPAPVVNAPVTTTPAPVPAPIKTEITPLVTAPVIATPTIATEVVAKEEKKTDKKEKATKETPVIDSNIIAEKKSKKNDKKNKSKETEQENGKQTQTVMGMGNEPIFGDMLDSSRGIVGETKEKEATKKAAVSKKNTPVGWDNAMFSHLDTDSLKKYREKKDSAKVQ